jgi:hypothetical protein
MPGDLSRDTFRPQRHFSAVREQQGRVHMDADWNEQVDIGHHLARTTTVDVVGPTGMPEADPGFLISPAPSSPGSDLVIGAGRAYVDGILVEHKPPPLSLNKVSGSGANTVWEVTGGERLDVGSWAGPQGDPLADLSRVASVVPPAYGDGGLLRLKFNKTLGAGQTKAMTALASVLHQPYLPGATLPDADGDYLAYLDVWERDVTVLEDPLIADVALAGPDTAFRTQVIWQVKLLALAPLVANGAIAAPPMRKAFGPGWRPDPSPPLAISAEATPTASDTNPCELPAQGGYRSLENHLYRVEVHRGGDPAAGEVLLKWSRDNAIHRTRLLQVVDGSLVVEELGKDEVTALSTDDWVEVSDEGRHLRGEPGFFVQIGEVVGLRLGIRTILDPVSQAPVVQGGKPDATVLPQTGLLRCWEGGVPAPLQPGQPFGLERGVQVLAGPAGGRAHVGDYWLIPARSLSAAVEWPADPATNAPAALPPMGVAHAYCPLAIVNLTGGGWSVKADCRNIFPPLTRLAGFFYRGGDGQEATPDLTQPAAFTALPAPLRVGVARGEAAVAGKPVRFIVVDDDGGNLGRLSPLAGTDPADVIFSAPQTLIVKTGPDGEAAAAFELANARHVHTVRAELLDTSDPAQASVIHLPIIFTAATSIASEVAYDPRKCVFQSDKGPPPGNSITVQQAIDKLCPRVEFLPLGGDDQTLCAKETAPGPLTVGIFWGPRPLEGVKVAFKVQGDAKVDPEVAVTDAQGVARTKLIGGDNVAQDGGVVRILAEAQDLPIASLPKTLEFGARFMQAQCVYVGPDVCPDGQGAMNSNTVAALLQFLCQQVGGGQPKGKGIRVLRAFRAKDTNDVAHSQPLVAYEKFDPPTLAMGLRLELDGEIDGQALKGHNNQPGYILLDLPFPASQVDQQIWTTVAQPTVPFPAGLALRLHGELVPSTSAGGRPELAWIPDPTTTAWLRTQLDNAMVNLRLTQISAELVLHGNMIYGGEGENLRYLDGNLFLNRAQQLGAVYPSGDGAPGGDFRLPFIIGRLQ